MVPVLLFLSSNSSLIIPFASSPSSTSVIIPNTSVVLERLAPFENDLIFSSFPSFSSLLHALPLHVRDCPRRSPTAADMAISGPRCMQTNPVKPPPRLTPPTPLVLLPTPPTLALLPPPRRRRRRPRPRLTLLTKTTTTTPRRLRLRRSHFRRPRVTFRFTPDIGPQADPRRNHRRRSLLRFRRVAR